MQCRLQPDPMNELSVIGYQSYEQLDGIICRQTLQGLKSTDKLPCLCEVYCQIYREEDTKNFKTRLISRVYPEQMVVHLKATFPYTCFSSNLHSLPRDNPRVLYANMGI